MTYNNDQIRPPLAPTAISAQSASSSDQMLSRDEYPLHHQFFVQY